MSTHPQTLRHFRNWIATLGDLAHRVALELVGEIASAHKGLLASKLGKKASTNLGAIQSWLEQMMARKPRMLVTVALANKSTGIIWALLMKQEEYKAPVAAAA